MINSRNLIYTNILDLTSIWTSLTCWPLASTCAACWALSALVAALSCFLRALFLASRSLAAATTSSGSCSTPWRPPSAADGRPLNAPWRPGRSQLRPWCPRVDKRGVVFAPSRQVFRLVLADIVLKLRVQGDVGLVIEDQVVLALGVTRLRGVGDV